MSVVESFEEVFKKRLKDMQDGWMHAMAFGPISDIDYREIRGKIMASESILREFDSLIQGYKDE